MVKLAKSGNKLTNEDVVGYDITVYYLDGSDTTFECRDYGYVSGQTILCIYDDVTFDSELSPTWLIPVTQFKVAHIKRKYSVPQ